MPFSSRSYVNRYIPSNRFPIGLKWLLIANVGIFVLYLHPQGQRDRPASSRTSRWFPRKSFRRLPSGNSSPTCSCIGGHLATFCGTCWAFGCSAQSWNVSGELPSSCVSTSPAGSAPAVTVVFAAYLFGVPGRRNRRFVGSGLRHSGGLRRCVSRPDGLVWISDSHEVQVLRHDHRCHRAPAVVHGDSRRTREALRWWLIWAACWLVFCCCAEEAAARECGSRSRGAYKEWKLRRAKKKFEVYLRKQDTNRDPLGSLEQSLEEVRP